MAFDWANGWFSNANSCRCYASHPCRADYKSSEYTTGLNVFSLIENSSIRKGMPKLQERRGQGREWRTNKSISWRRNRRISVKIGEEFGSGSAAQVCEQLVGGSNPFYSVPSFQGNTGSWPIELQNNTIFIHMLQDFQQSWWMLRNIGRNTSYKLPA